MKTPDKTKIVFLDRDGVINKIIMRKGEVSSPRKIEEFEFLPNIFSALKKFQEIGFLNIIFTNQPDISRGLLKKEELEKMNKLILSSLPIDEIIFCPHDDKDNCSCRKPKPGMILEAAKKHFIDLRKSYVVGDGQRDIEAGRAAGCKTFLIKTEYNKNIKEGYDFLVDNLEGVVEIIKRLNSKI